ncbi:MAG: DUF2442 domain-containing protein [Flavobacteriales bacterium]|jgi:hypothetical protein|nr:DUF2442 domain-containing protein [Flavobacteriales bacterium]MBK6892352.1 DUF2442 domain-containing protein [Flavobacteriales bacterium]MBK7246492.1 DUF2442 domain-containing protein [Flavobacteriales bacterium]MBK7288257.1 DUF2442 domain-containing protein [Flavobacteriales bacterium]MBK9060665.1 DUF2442 domain-containing protein [Flavobacteriales bacterium]
MKIAEDVRIKKATYLHDYAIRFTFTDGHVSEIDFHPFLSAAGQNPMNSQYLDVTRFRKFKLHRNVDVFWDDWEMCFRFETLYSGKLPKMPKRLSIRSRRGSAQHVGQDQE